MSLSELAERGDSSPRHRVSPYNGLAKHRVHFFPCVFNHLRT